MTTPTNHETHDDKGDKEEEDNKDSDINKNNSVGSTGTISTLTTTTTTNNNNRETRDNDANVNVNANNNNLTTIWTPPQWATATSLRIPCKHVSNGRQQGGGDDNDNADANADDVDVHTRLQDAVSFAKTPKDFIPHDAKSALDEPPWSMVGNPGLWDQYCFRPKFDWNKEGKYLHHQLPLGCTPVPGEGTKRKCDNWDSITLDGFKKPCYFRRYVLPSMVDFELFFPSKRKGLLNMRKLKLHGLTKERLILGDALFFYQLLLPLHLDPVDEAEEEDLSLKRKPSLQQGSTDHELVSFASDQGKPQAELTSKPSTFNYAYKFDYIYVALVHNTQYFMEKVVRICAWMNLLGLTMDLVVPWETMENVREFLLNEEYMEYLVFGKKKKKEGEVEGAKEQSSISITELTADLISAVDAV
eukprot:jgi/Psemu1/15072/gm1.15072_g